MIRAGAAEMGPPPKNLWVREAEKTDYHSDIQPLTGVRRFKTFDHQLVEPVVSESRVGISPSFFFEDPLFSSRGNPIRNGTQRRQGGGCGAG